MTEPELTDLGAGTRGASDTGAQEPRWIRVRGTTNYALNGEMVRRDHLYEVDPDQPDVQHALRYGWIIPLPEDQQPQLAEESS